MPACSGRDERILILAPVGRDAVLAQASLREAGIAGEISADIEEVCREAAAGAGAILLTQEALSATNRQRLLALMQGLPPWSDLPLIVLVSGGASTPALRHLTTELGQRLNVTFLERPVRTATLVNAVQVALRARRRQYELRDHLQALAQSQEAERQARATAEQAVRVRDEFLASVAHDLKNPLGAVLGYAQLLQRHARKLDRPEAGKLGEGLTKIEAMVLKAVAQIDELLDVARLQAHQPLPLNLEPVDLVALTRRVAAEYGQVSAHHVLRIETDLPELIGVWDLHRLERVLGNLLSNAIKYSPDGSEILVEVRQEAEGTAVLVVRDRGIGIPAEDLPHIFERFHRASNTSGRAGTGLGLAGVKQIVEQHGGTVSVTSEEGRGTTVTLRLPLTASR